MKYYECSVETYQARLILDRFVPEFDGIRARGKIFEDWFNRFEDGTTIQTSVVEAMVWDCGHLFVKTKNTTYLVV